MEDVLDRFFARMPTGSGALVLAGLLLALLGATPLRAEERDCPSHPEATFVLSGDPDTDKSQISRLADPAKEKGAVCIMAYYDGQGPANSKMLALRRANWVMEQFTDKGVSSGSITRVLRAADKASSRTVQIILGP